MNKADAMALIDPRTRLLLEAPIGRTVLRLVACHGGGGAGCRRAECDPLHR